MFRLGICCIVLALLPASTANQCTTEKKNAYFWRIQDDRRQAPVFLFGTIHVAWNQVWPHVDPNVRRAFDLADTVVVELALNKPELRQLLSQCRELPPDVRLDSLIGRRLVRRLSQYLEQRRAVLTKAVFSHRSIQMNKHAQTLINFESVIFQWRNKKPTWVLFMLFHLLQLDATQQTEPMLDLFLANEASKDGKHIHSLESPQEQCDPFDSIPTSDIATAIEHTLNFLLRNKQHSSSSDAIGRKPMQSLLEKYNCGTLDESIFDATEFLEIPSSAGVLAQSIQSQIKHKMFTERNRRMARRLHEYFTASREDAVFIAVGAGHFLGPLNTLNELRNTYNYSVDLVAVDDTIEAVAPSKSKVVSDYKVVRNLWERGQSFPPEVTAEPKAPHDFVTWRLEYPPEIFSRTAARPLPVLLWVLAALALCITH